MKLTGRLVCTATMVLSMVLLTMMTVNHGVAQAQDGDQGTYSVVILDNQTRDDSERGKQLLEGWGYTPITISQQGDQFSVLYGEFDSAAAARQAMGQLRNEGISAQGVVPTPSLSLEPAPLVIGAYAVVVQEFKTSNNAMLLQQTLSQAGFTPVSVRQAGNYYRVLITNLSHEEAILTLGQLRQQGYMTARVRRMDSLTTPPPAVPSTAAQVVQQTPEPASEEDYGISAAVMQTDLWTQLTEDQKREVIKSMAIQEQLRKGDALAQEVIDINKRLNGLDENVREIISRIEQEKATAERERGEIGELFKEANNLMRAEDYQEAIVRLNKILALDKDNQYGQAALARRQIERAESRLRDERYEGQSKDIENRYQALKADAERLSINKNSASDLQTALGLWIQIKNLDTQKYGTTANARISELNQDLANLREKNELALNQSRKMMMYITAGLGGGFVLLLLMLILVWLRGRARHNQLMLKMQEITSIRPMRELQGGPAGILEGSEGESTDYDIFAPQTPKSKPKPQEEDSMGGLGDTQKEAEHTATQTETSPVDDVFGSMNVREDEPTVKAMNDDMNFANLFGDEEETAGAGGVQTEASSPVEPETVEDSYSNISEELPVSEEVTEGASEPMVTPQAGKDEDDEVFHETEVTRTVHPENDGEAISFDDIMASGSDVTPVADESPAGKEKEQPEDLLALFDDVVGPSSDDTVPPTQESNLDHLKDSPFSSMLEEEESRETEASSADMGDEVEIPSIDLGEESLESDSTVRNEEAIEEPKEAEDLPAFSLEDITAVSDNEPPTQESAPIPNLAGGALVEMDFKDDEIGGKPQNWEGDYEYATLAIENGNPPSGGDRYLCFRKSEGGGKAFYTCSFPEVRGKVQIDFDLCCQEKNKFLLGFYIEKDAHFQSSIHTKILRSETQTTPTIHMQGESAPYLMGSWAHIRYIIDLDEGVVNGYIDSTHVAHDLSLVQNPGSLNTFSIRDNINTTGVLMLANLRVYPVQ